MAIEISLLRHGETEANAAGVWQGTEDSPLSEAGLGQVALVGKRGAGAPYDLVVTSNLGRAQETARALGRPEVDTRWRELHLGAWEGRTRQEITQTDPESLAELGSGRDIAFGGGERVSEMLERLNEAFTDLASRLDDGDRAVVVSHGGALTTLISHLLAVNARGRLVPLTNTAISTVRIEGGTSTQLAVFNDSTHLPDAPVRAEEGATHVILARHGETIANVEGRWQGQSHGELTTIGREQARRLGGGFPVVKALFSSPLRRAVDTANLMTAGTGMTPRPVEDLQEFGFGSWEMKTFHEIARIDPEGLSAISAGVDVARGGSGETFAAMRERVARAVALLAEEHAGDMIGVVSHGAATRAYATEILGIDFEGRRRLRLLENAAIGSVVYGSRGPALGSWNLTAHLEL
jgi:broad specificity phosphatase PhoE